MGYSGEKSPAESRHASLYHRRPAVRPQPARLGHRLVGRSDQHAKGFRAKPKLLLLDFHLHIHHRQCSQPAAVHNRRALRRAANLVRDNYVHLRTADSVYSFHSLMVSEDGSSCIVWRCQVRYLSWPDISLAHGIHVMNSSSDLRFGSREKLWFLQRGTWSITVSAM